MKNRNLAFAALVLTALGSFLLFYPVYRWSETLAFGSMILGVALSLILLGWSVWSCRRRPARALVGLFVCGYCFYQILVIPGFIMAVKKQREQPQPNKRSAPNARLESLWTIGHRWPGVGEPERWAGT